MFGLLNIFLMGNRKDLVFPHICLVEEMEKRGD